MPLGGPLRQVLHTLGAGFTANRLAFTASDRMPDSTMCAFLELLHGVLPVIRFVGLSHDCHFDLLGHTQGIVIGARHQRIGRTKPSEVDDEHTVSTK